MESAPLSLEHLTLADWAAWYESGGKPCIKKSFTKDADNLPLETADSDENDDDLLDCNAIDSKKSKKRLKARIIRSVWYNREKKKKNRKTLP